MVASILLTVSISISNVNANSCKVIGLRAYSVSVLQCYFDVYGSEYGRSIT